MKKSRVIIVLKKTTELDEIERSGRMREGSFFATNLTNILNHIYKVCVMQDDMLKNGEEVNINMMMIIIFMIII